MIRGEALRRVTGWLQRYELSLRRSIYSRAVRRTGSGDYRRAQESGLVVIAPVHQCDNQRVISSVVYRKRSEDCTSKSSALLGCFPEHGRLVEDLAVRPNEEWNTHKEYDIPVVLGYIKALSAGFAKPLKLSASAERRLGDETH